MSFLNYTYRLYPTKKECIKINQIITLYKKICDSVLSMESYILRNIKTIRALKFYMIFAT